MKKICFKGLRVGLLLAVLLFNFGFVNTQTAHAVSAPPVHDNFANAKTISGITYQDLNVDTTGATQQTLNSPNGADPDKVLCQRSAFSFEVYRGTNTVWYKYQNTTGKPISVSLDTKGSTPLGDYDTYIAVWTGNESNLSLVGCNDEDWFGQTAFSFIANTTDTYYIEVAHFAGNWAASPGPTTGNGGLLQFHAYITNVDVSIGDAKQESYYLYNTDTLIDNYPGVFNGPLQVKNTSGEPLIATERTLYGASFHETRGIPANQLTTEYWFPWYDFKTMQTWISVGNPSPTQTANVSIYIAGQFKGSQAIPPAGRWTPYYPGVFDGPVQVKSTAVLETAGGQSNVAGLPILVSERTLFGQNFNETNGIPANQLVSEYWFPWYDFLVMQTWISVGNPSGSQTANVSIYIAGQFKGSMAIPPNGRWTPYYSGVFTGPVQVKSTAVLETAGGQSNVAGIPIIATERTLYGQSFNETPGIPLSDLTTEYWLPMYDSQTMNTWISVGNPSGSQTAHVSVYIDGVFKESSNIPPNGKWTPIYSGVVGGPLQVKSTAVLESPGNPSNTPGQPVFVSTRTLLGTSFSETNGIPANQLVSEYWFTWYDYAYMQTWLSIARP